MRAEISGSAGSLSIRPIRRGESTSREPSEIAYSVRPERRAHHLECCCTRSCISRRTILGAHLEGAFERIGDVNNSWRHVGCDDRVSRCPRATVRSRGSLPSGFHVDVRGVPRPARRGAPSRFASRLAAIACVACAAPFASAAGAPAGSTPDSPVGDALRLWIDANEQVELEGVYFGESDTPRARRDVGVFAAVGGLDEGEAYVSVPWDLVLGPHSIEAHRPELHRVLTQLRAEYGADDKSALVLALVHERFASPEDSPWRRYLDALPDPDADGSGFDTPLYWDPHLLRELMGSEVLDDAIAEQARIRAVHQGFTRRVFDASPPARWPDRARSFEATRWAWSIAHSRASAVPGKGLALVPLADMINDRGRNPAAADSNPVAGADFVVHDPHYDRAAVYAKRSYTPGEEVTEYYGGWNMADTLLSAGYLPAPAAVGEDPAVSDCALLNLSPPDETKASALRDAGFETPWRVCLSARRGSREARRVAAWAVIVAGDAADRSDDEDAAGSSSPGASRRGCRQDARARLAEYPTAAEEDEDAARVPRGARGDGEGDGGGGGAGGGGGGGARSASDASGARHRTPSEGEADNVADPLRSSRRRGGRVRVGRPGLRGDGAGADGEGGTRGRGGRRGGRGGERVGRGERHVVGEGARRAVTVDSHEWITINEKIDS